MAVAASIVALDSLRAPFANSAERQLELPASDPVIRAGVSGTSLKDEDVAEDKEVMS